MNKWRYSILTIYVLLSVYLLIVAIRVPFVSIAVDTTNEQAVITSFYYPKWAHAQHIEKGDFLLAVDGQPIQDNRSVQRYSVVRGASSLTIEKPDGTIKTISVKHQDIPIEFYLHVVFPIVYFIFSFGVACYLWRKTMHHALTNLLIYFLLTCSLAYTSTGASGRGNIVGMFVVGIGILLCLVLLIHFLQRYCEYLHIAWPHIQAKWLYILPILLGIGDVFILYVPHIRETISVMNLTIFAFLLLYIIYILLRSYLQTKSAKIRFIAVALITPFLPFLLLFVIPEILNYPPFLRAEFAALFLLMIPFSFIFIQVNERLFDLEYQLSRLRYYSSLAFWIALLFIGGTMLFFIKELPTVKVISLFIFTFLLLVASFYLKEQLDFKYRKVIFSSTGNYVHNLYAAVHHMGKAKNLEELLERFRSELAEKLRTTAFSIERTTEDMSFHAGEIHTTFGVTHLLLYDTGEEKIILSIHHVLQKEELLWLELLALYVSMFIDNLKQMEDLIREIQHIRTTNNAQLPWLDTLLWNMIEKEKSILAQELHDTILQEQLHLARELDLLTDAPTIQKDKVLRIREQLLDATHDLREYCENLSPPLLDTFGLQIALKKLIQKTKIRADFLVHAQIEPVHFHDAALHLVVYRLVQELLNNAIKHAEATEVSLQLQATANGFILQYDDNGIGCDVEDLMPSSASMGINGIRERVRAFNGSISITSQPNEGMHIIIQIQENGDFHD
ncbi:ATP-binding protein [Lysinibacillus piscis]|uniref:ATPase n=1 Tax=Lysinibacillus piscis TaxID=2518931 RepID=A0ABQ5NLF5_9BACI|nr:ATP-binding protein [Lysinibacillus sp. KH24]GLC88953.1 ATPase [Lysinibacillus sp. KH24]